MGSYTGQFQQIVAANKTNRLGEVEKGEVVLFGLSQSGFSVYQFNFKKQEWEPLIKK